MKIASSNRAIASSPTSEVVITLKRNERGINIDSNGQLRQEIERHLCDGASRVAVNCGWKGPVIGRFPLTDIGWDAKVGASIISHREFRPSLNDGLNISAREELRRGWFWKYIFVVFEKN